LLRIFYFTKFHFKKSNASKCWQPNISGRHTKQTGQSINVPSLIANIYNRRLLDTMRSGF
jgi:hypothetical protein